MVGRFQRWCTASLGRNRIEPHMIIPAQGLGRLDIRLRDNDSTFRSGVSDPAVAEAFMEHLTLSYLWVLGGYELIRSVDQRCSQNSTIVSPSLAGRVKEIKKAFERLRVPLAKFEPARAHQNTDLPIAWPAMSPSAGVAWRVSEATYVSRQELGEFLLGLLEAIHAELERDTA